MTSRLPGVDGLRAIAALWVVLFHIVAFSGARFPQIPGLDLFLRSGSVGVSLFLVLSGFCLFLPFAGGRTARFKVWDFLLRRCRRLMPAYYVALAGALLLAIATSGRLGFPPFGFDDALWQVATHLTLTHTLFPSTFYSLNGAFWSLGLEWQLYLALPLLVWITRRFGLTRAVIFAVIVNMVYRLAVGEAIAGRILQADSLLASVVLPNQITGRWAEFAFGMLAADLYATGRLRSWSKYVPAMLVAIVVLVPTSIVASQFQLGHIVYGVLFFTLLSVVLVGENRVAGVMSWRPLVALGTMSYSLYLVHQPILQLTAEWLQIRRPDLAPNQLFMILLGLLFPVILLIAWILFLTVERRTLGAHSRDALMPRFRLSWLSPVGAAPTTAVVPESVGSRTAQG